MKQRVWDLPLRLFHWTLVILVAVSLYTGITGGFKEMDYHMLSGYAILALILFRIVWGFVGSHHARFHNFFRPGQLVTYSRQVLDRPGIKTIGHNPLGALSIFALILSLGVQAGTGLFANDDIFLEGPLVHLVGDEWSDQLTTIHHFNAKVLYGLIGLHLTAILLYELYKGQRLLLPMITGRKEIEEGQEVTATAANPVREILTSVILISICGGSVYYLINHV